MKISTRLSLGLLGLVLMGGASAQVASTSNSNQSTTASSSTNAQQANGQSITFNSAAAPTRTTERVESAPGMGLGSFGTSFSSDNCSNTIAGQLSVVGFGASAGKALLEQNCARLRRGYAFGQAAAFAAANHQPDLANKAEAMVFYEFCMAGGKDSDDVKACEDMGLVKTGDKANDPQVAAAVVQRQQEDTQQQQQQVALRQNPPMGISAVHTGYNQSGTTGH